MTSHLANWTSSQYETLEKGVLLAQHRLHETGLFSDESLARILDTHPADCLHISTMGMDENEYEWREGDRNGVSGEVLLETMKRGRLWVNVRNMLQHHDEIRRTFHAIYDELEAHCPGFQARQRSANLLISSPGAQVHYHIDVPVNMLWHVRGRKRVWVYPHFDFRFVPQRMVERVCSGEAGEDVPYDPDFDSYALVFDVEPGQLLTWPQLTPHRVMNLEGLNVSVSTEHHNATATRRINVHLANQFLRRTLGWDRAATDVHGLTPRVKQTLARGVRYWRKFTHQSPPRFSFPVTFKVDPSAPLGFSDLVDHPEDHILVPCEDTTNEPLAVG